MNVRLRMAGLLVACGLAMVTMSCRHRVTSAGMTVESFQGTQVKANSTVFGRQFRVVQSAIARGDNGLLQATITLENLKKDCQIEYRYRWLDDQGIEVRSGTSIWTPLAVGSRESKLLSGIAPSKAAADFILDIRFSFKSTRW
jgi:uncharacterized protein YcfL